MKPIDEHVDERGALLVGAHDAVGPRHRARGPAVLGGGVPPRKATRASAMRSPVLPSQPSGTRPVFARPARIASTAAEIRATSSPTIVLVPSVTVIGRSVPSRIVRHGMPR